MSGCMLVLSTWLSRIKECYFSVIRLAWDLTPPCEGAAKALRHPPQTLLSASSSLITHFIWFSGRALENASICIAKTSVQKLKTCLTPPAPSPSPRIFSRFPPNCFSSSQPLVLLFLPFLPSSLNHLSFYSSVSPPSLCSPSSCQCVGVHPLQEGHHSLMPVSPEAVM